MKYKKVIIMLLLIIIILLVNANLMLFYMCKDISSAKLIEKNNENGIILLEAENNISNESNIVVRNSQKGESGEVQEVHENYKINISSGDIDLIAKLLYFRANYFFDWCISYKQIDNTFFSYTKKDFDRLGGK